jgi:hypothetical protein
MLCLVILVACLGGGQKSEMCRQKTNEILFPVSLGGRWGFIDRSGNLVLEPRFQAASPFSEGLARVSLPGTGNRVCGYIDTGGNWAIPPGFSDGDSFSDGLAPVSINGRAGYVDKAGNLVGEAAAFDHAWRFAEGLGRIRVRDRFGYVDRSGRVVIQPHFAWADDFREGMAVVAVRVPRSGLKVGFIDRSGRFLIRPQYSAASGFSDGVALVATEGTAYIFEGVLSLDADRPPAPRFINLHGMLAFKTSFEKAASFSEGLAAVQIGGRWGYIDRRGRITIQPEYESANRFSDGIAWVERDGRYLALDKNGQVLFTSKFDAVDDFAHGLAEVRLRNAMGTWEIGYVDRTGKLVWKPSI